MKWGFNGEPHSSIVKSPQTDIQPLSSGQTKPNIKRNTKKLCEKAVTFFSSSLPCVSTKFKIFKLKTLFPRRQNPAGPRYILHHINFFPYLALPPTLKTICTDPPYGLRVC